MSPGPNPSLAALGAAALIVVLSASLWKARGENAQYRAELAENAQAFKAGSSLPSLPVHSAEGPLRLDSLCRRSRPLVVYFSRRDCKACDRLSPLWDGMRRESALDLVQVHLDGVPASTAATGGIRHVAASPGSVLREVRVATVPAVLSADRNCRLTGSAAGLNASRIVLQRAFAPHPGET